MGHAARWVLPVIFFAACGSRGALNDGAARGDGGTAPATGGAGGRGTGGAGGGTGGAVACRAGDGGAEDARCPAGQICVGHVYIADNGSKSVYPSVCKSDLCGDRAISCDCDGPLCADWGIVSCSVSDGALSCTQFGICASPETPIATPDGTRAIADLRPGDLVYSVDGAALRPVPIVRISRTRVQNHHVVEVRTTDGAVLEMSAGHPTADGRTFGDLRVGDRLDGVPIVSRRVIPYSHLFTYDIEPASDTGTYVASGRLVGSTLGPLGGLRVPDAAGSSWAPKGRDR